MQILTTIIKLNLREVAIDCYTLHKLRNESCSACMKRASQEKKKTNRKNKKLTMHAKLNALISQTSCESLLLTIREQRSENARLTNEITRIKEELVKLSVPLSE